VNVVKEGAGSGQVCCAVGLKCKKYYLSTRITHKRALHISERRMHGARRIDGCNDTGRQGAVRSVDLGASWTLFQGPRLPVLQGDGFDASTQDARTHLYRSASCHCSTSDLPACPAAR
jgi:hypothetical protein